MIGLKHARRWVLWFASLAIVAGVGLCLCISAKPAAAADTGTIEGGKFVVDAKGEKVPVDDVTATSLITLNPPAPGAHIDVNDGHIKITNVPTGTYSVTLNFKYTAHTCFDFSGPNALGSSTGSCTRGLITGSPQDQGTPSGYFTFSKTWQVTVTAGQTTLLEGTDANSEKTIGNAIETTESGNPIVNCDGKGMLMEFIICPLIENTLGTINWVVDNFIQPYLAVNPITTKNDNGQESQIYKVWNNTRNIANVAFIAAFFVIVFSQSTSIGITNYGIKKLLPRLVLIVIGTNISFFVCAFLIDLFNVLGAGVASLLISGIIDGQPTISIGDNIFNLLFNLGPVGDMLSLFTLGILAAPIIFGMFIFLFVGAIILFIAAIIIILRQIMLIFLIIASPLAFVAGLLPNTQKMFTQWFTLFGRLLAMYPIIMALFAASKIASTILGNIGK